MNTPTHHFTEAWLNETLDKGFHAFAEVVEQSDLTSRPGNIKILARVLLDRWDVVVRFFNSEEAWEGETIVPQVEVELEIGKLVTDAVSNKDYRPLVGADFANQIHPAHRMAWMRQLLEAVSTLSVDEIDWFYSTVNAIEELKYVATILEVDLLAEMEGLAADPEGPRSLELATLLREAEGRDVVTDCIKAFAFLHGLEPMPDEHLWEIIDAL